MPADTLASTFNFRVTLTQAAGTSGASAGVGASVSASASVGVSASVSASASIGGSASLGGGASLGGSASLDAGASLSASASLSAGVSAGVSVGASIGGGGSGAALGDGGFQECSGLQIEMDVQELEEGGRNDGMVRLVGRGKYQPIVLKRGMLFPASGTVRGELWAWLQQILSGVRPVRRYDGVIEVLTNGGTEVVATWTFDRGLPTRISGPQLNAKTGEIAIEELTIAHEGLRLRT